MSKTVCPRCGGFAQSLVPSLEVCRACGDKVLPVPLRGPLAARGLLGGVAHVLARVGPRAALLSLLFGLPGDLLLWLLPEAPLSLQIGYFTLVPLVAELAIMVMAHEALLGRAIDVGDAFAQGLPAYGAVLAARLRAGLLTLLWALLLILPGIYQGARYSLVTQVALFEPQHAHAATRLSSERTRGTVWLLVAAELALYTISVGVPLGVTVGLQVVGAEESGEWLTLALDLVLGALSTLALTLLLLVQQVVYDKTAVDEALTTHAGP